MPRLQRSSGRGSGSTAGAVERIICALDEDEHPQDGDLVLLTEGNDLIDTLTGMKEGDPTG